METKKNADSGKYDVCYEFKPDKTAALWYPLILVMIPTGLAGGIFSAISLMGGAPLVALGILAVAGGIVFLSWLHLKARLSKSVFTLYKDRLVAKTGGLLSDSTNELAVRNITYVAYQLPFLERIFFKTGTIRIESAGSGGCEIRMFHLKDPLDALEPVFELLRQNNFRMKLGTPVQEHRVAGAGKIIDLIGQGFTYLLVFFFITADIIGKGDVDYITAAVIFSIFAVVCLFILGVRYLDLQSRRYRLYMDAVDFEEGFFTYVKVFIPAENISDTNVDVGILGRIFGYCDVKVSCQGAGKEITFAYLSDGTRLIEGLDATIEEMRHKSESEQSRAVPALQRTLETETIHPEGVADGKEPSSSESTSTIKGEEVFTGDRSYRKSFTQYMMRAVAPSLIVILGGIIVATCVAIIMAIAGASSGDCVLAAIGIIGVTVLVVAATMISAAVGAIFTKYEIKEDSVATSFEFIVKRNQEFSFDKVTSVVMYHNPLDWFFKTVSIKFTSIGSSTPLYILHQQLQEIDESKVLAKCGIFEGTSNYTLKPQWSVPVFLTAPGSVAAAVLWCICVFTGIFISHDSLSIADSLVADGVILLVGAGIFGLSGLWSSVVARYCSIDLSDDHLLGKTGVLFRNETHVPYRYVKGTRVLHNFLSTPSQVFVDIAGEILVGKGQNGQQIIVSNNFSIPFISDGDRFVDCLNAIVSTERKARNAKACIEERLNSTNVPSTPFKAPVLEEYVPNQIQIMIFKILAVVIIFGFAALMFALSEIYVASFICCLLAVPVIILAIVQARVIRYQICELDAAMEWGVFFRQRKTVCYHQFDFIKNEQGAVNKIFGTGNVNIHTTGSSMVEINFYALPNYNEFETKLKQRY